MVDGRMLVDSTLDDFRNRVAAWVIEATDDPTIGHTIPGLVHCRSLGSRWHVTVADPNEATFHVIEKFGSNAAPTETSFEDAVLAYLSRSRVGHSFYTGATS